MRAFADLSHRVAGLWRREEGAVGWLLLGIIAGIALVIFGVYELVSSFT
jgi:hypothetical protein